MISEIKELLHNNCIDDIYLVGFMDMEDGFAEFYPDYTFIYFEIGNKFIELQSVDQFSRLSLKVIDSIAYEFEIDADMVYGKSSIKNMVLTDSMALGNEIKKLLLFNFDDNKAYSLCDALQIELMHGQQIFIDPTFYYGINIGGLDQKLFWENNLVSHNRCIPESKTILITS